MGADRVARGKPHPDLALAGAQWAGVPCHRTWLVGDTREDLIMGHQAGVARRIGMTGGACTRAELESCADGIVESWDDPALS